MEEFDAAAYKAETRKVWDATCPGWEASLEYFERGAAAVTARLLELADLRPGQSVLDVATGHGEPALTAAGVVGPTGRVVGIDLAPRMVAAARARARAAGVDHVTFAVADLEDLDGAGVGEGFDAVLSRFGLMFAVDHVAAFRTLARRLRPGGVLAAAVWGPPDRHLMSVGPVALAERIGLPAPAVGVPGPYGMADGGRLRADLVAAGFGGVQIGELVAPYWFSSVEEYVRFNRAALPPPMLARVAERFGSVDDPDTWAAVGGAAERYAGGDGVLRLPSVALCLRAVRPA
jgi:SAM-dependent methyltransferase